MCSDQPSAPFVGRERELADLQAWVSAGSGAAFVHGPGGIGKTTLLDAFGRLAEAAGLVVERVDGREGGSPASLTAILERAGAGTLLIVDTFELAPALGDLVRQSAAPGLRVVLAGREPPGADWPGATEIVLLPLDEDAARALVRAWGVESAADVERVSAWAAGSPLSLAIAAEAVSAGLALDLREADADALLARTVLRAGFVGTDHEVIAVAATARAVDARTLAAVLPGVDGNRAEAWLRDLSFAEPLGTRVALHERVRQAVHLRLLDTDREYERDLRRRLADHFFARMMTGERWLLSDLAALIDDPAIRWGIAPPPAFTHRYDRVRPGDLEEIERLDGLPTSAWRPGLHRWLTEAPERGGTVRDRAGALCAYQVSLTAANAPPWASEDAIAGPWLADIAARGRGAEALVLREHDYFDVPAGEASAAVAIANVAVVLGSGLRTARYLYAGIDRERPGYAGVRGFLEAMGYSRREDLDVPDADRLVECFTCDFGVGGVFRAIRDLVYLDLQLPPPPPPDAVEELGAKVVREALRGFHDPLALARSPLARGATTAERAEMVRTLLREAIDAAFGDTPEEQLQQATIERGYLDSDGGHQRAALELRLGRTTYYRRLAGATLRVAAYVASLYPMFDLP